MDNKIKNRIAKSNENRSQPENIKTGETVFRKENRKNKSTTRFISNQYITIESEEHLYRLLTLMKPTKYSMSKYLYLRHKPIHQTKFLIVPNYI